MSLHDLQISEVQIGKKIHHNDHSHIFHATVRGHQCVMKVHHGRGPRQYFESKDRELDIHVCEANAYRRLKERGICSKGFVPDFLGSIRHFDPNLCLPHLRRFVEDEYPPSAIFLQYIPGLETLTLENYTPQRMKNFMSALDKIHDAGILHGDPKPRNMMVLSDKSSDIVWLDFDRAEVYQLDNIPERGEGFIEEEKELVREAADQLDHDSQKGEIDQSFLFFYGY